MLDATCENSLVAAAQDSDAAGTEDFTLPNTQQGGGGEEGCSGSPRGTQQAGPQAYTGADSNAGPGQDGHQTGESQHSGGGGSSGGDAGSSQQPKQVGIMRWGLGGALAHGGIWYRCVTMWFASQSEPFH